MSDGPTRYYLYIPVWATGRAPQGGGSSNYSTPSGSTPESTYSTPTSTPSMPPSYSTTGDVIYTTGPGGSTHHEAGGLGPQDGLFRQPQHPFDG